MTDNDIKREVTFEERAEYFKKRYSEVLEEYESLDGDEDPLYICVLQDGLCAIKKAEETINRLQAEIENLKDTLYDAEGVNLVNYWYQQCEIAENGNRNFDEENKKLKAENEKLKNENDSMRKDIAQSVNELKNLGVLYAKDISKAKDEAMTKLADRLQIRCIKQDGCLWSSDIGAELKEILEEE